MVRIILASGSPRRRKLLNRLELSFSVRIPDVDETVPNKVTSFPCFAKNLALKKARAIHRHNEDAVVIAADTVVVIDKRILGKPRNKKEAVEMLLRLSGKKHRVITGIAVVSPRSFFTGACSTDVWFKKLSARFIKNYIDSKEPMDKSGAYAIQGMGKQCVKKIKGDYHNVVGLPLHMLCQLLAKAGITTAGVERKQERCVFSP